ncbi:MAG: serine hydrolase [Pseudomonadota bacterium]
MSTQLRKALISVALIFIVSIAGLAFYLTQSGTARTVSAYKAKILCSEVFVAKREASIVRSDEFNDIHPILAAVGTRIDRSANIVTASLFGLGRATAVHQAGSGCTVLPSNTDADIAYIGYQYGVLADGQPANWNTAFADQPHPGVDYQRLQDTFTGAAADKDAGHRALLVAVDGKLVGEWYAEGFSRETPFLSWSMAKSVTATLIGAAVQDGLLAIDQPLGLAQWEKDDRRALTWSHLLHMQSGLAFDEDYASAKSDVNRMLFSAASAGGVAALAPLAYPVGTHWSYSSGTSNILAMALAANIAATGQSLSDYADEKLFTPLGISDATMERDAAGNFIGSSYLYASARSWLRLGDLYLNNGQWQGKRLLPAGWTDYVATPTAQSDNQYGAHFWLNREGRPDPQTGAKRPRFFPALPEDTYFFSGHDGQYVIIIPQQKMVIVRLGLTRTPDPLARVAPTIASLYASVAR